MTHHDHSDSFDVPVDTSEFALPLVIRKDPDEPTFSQRAAQVREQARAAVADETYRILEHGRSHLQQQQLRRDLELSELRARARKSTVKTGLMALLVAAAAASASVFAVVQSGGSATQLLEGPTMSSFETALVSAFESTFENSEPSEVSEPAAPTPADELDAETEDAASAPAQPKIYRPRPAQPEPVEAQDEGPSGQFDIVTEAEVVECGDPNDPLNSCL